MLIIDEVDQSSSQISTSRESLNFISKCNISGFFHELKNFLKDIKSNKQSTGSNGNPAFGENNFSLSSHNTSNNMNQTNISYDANAFSSAYSSY